MEQNQNHISILKVFREKVVTQFLRGPFQQMQNFGKK